MTMLEKAARAAASAMGYDFDAVFADKSEWTRHLGDKGNGFVDINDPFQCDFIDAARAVLEAVRDVSEPVSWRALERLGGDVCCFDFTYTRAREVHAAMIDHILTEGKIK